MRKYSFTGGTAIVTGAASGIGEALAHGLAGRGSDLVLLDRDAERLDAVATSLRETHSAQRVSTLVVDLSDRAETARAGEKLAAEHPRTTLLINNAGVALGGGFHQVTLEEFNWVMDINFHAVVTLTHHMLPVLIANPGSHLVNISSLFGLIAPAGQTAYSSSKYAVRGFTESLRHDLEIFGYPVGVTCVHPGGIRTRIAESARSGSGVPTEEIESGKRDFAKLLTIAPSEAAADIISGIERRKNRVLIGWSAKLPDLLARAFPASYGKILTAAMRRQR